MGKKTLSPSSFGDEGFVVGVVLGVDVIVDGPGVEDVAFLRVDAGKSASSLVFQPHSLPLSQKRMEGWLTSRVTISLTTLWPMSSS